MNKNEFIDGLGKSLRGKVDENEYRNQIEYYSSYISNEIASGRREEDVVAELGDPRLIAKTIVNTYVIKDNPINNQYNEYGNNTYSEEEEGNSDMKNGIDSQKIKKIIYTIIAVMFVLFVVSLVLKIFRLVLPIIFICVVTLIIVRLVNGR